MARSADQSQGDLPDGAASLVISRPRAGQPGDDANYSPTWLHGVRDGEQAAPRTGDKPLRAGTPGTNPGVPARAGINRGVPGGGA
jgi:hypothetical protein